MMTLESSTRIEIKRTTERLLENGKTIEALNQMLGHCHDHPSIDCVNVVLTDQSLRVINLF